MVSLHKDENTSPKFYHSIYLLVMSIMSRLYIVTLLI